MQRAFSYAQLLFDCYLLQVPKGQGRYIAGRPKKQIERGETKDKKLTASCSTCFET